MIDICIIGGGAAGMAAAIEAKRNNPKASVLVVEKNEKLGVKIYATGNGRCNISNVNSSNLDTVTDFFDSIGLMLFKEEDRLYPHSNQASSVVEALERQINILTIKTSLNSDVNSLKKINDCFHLTLKDGKEIIAKKVLIAAGGKAAPQYGTTGDGYALAKGLGHKIVKVAPALMPLICAGDVGRMKGSRVKGVANLLADDKIIARESGEIQFTQDGLSGISIFNLSRLVTIRENENISEGFLRYRILIDLVQEKTLDQLNQYLLNKAELMNDFLVEDLIHSIVNSKLIDYIIKDDLGEEKSSICISSL